MMAHLSAQDLGCRASGHEVGGEGVAQQVRSNLDTCTTTSAAYSDLHGVGCSLEIESAVLIG